MRGDVFYFLFIWWYYEVCGLGLFGCCIVSLCLVGCLFGLFWVFGFVGLFVLVVGGLFWWLGGFGLCRLSLLCDAGFRCFYCLAVCFGLVYLCGLFVTGFALVLGLWFVGIGLVCMIVYCEHPSGEYCYYIEWFCGLLWWISCWVVLGFVVFLLGCLFGVWLLWCVSWRVSWVGCCLLVYEFDVGCCV